jgi:hypothetical protein
MNFWELTLNDYSAE